MDIRDLGLVRYEDVLKFQVELVRRPLAGEASDTLILVEHPPVVTMGRMAEEDSLIERGYFEKRGIAIIPTNRGGKITYHAPGQLVLYPVLDLKKRRRDVSFYIDFLEKTVARSLNRLDVPASRDRERRGVWVDGRKIAFIGIALRRWVTFHGVSVNINNDLEPFSRMHPCGEMDIEVTSARQVLGRQLQMPGVKKVFAEQFVSDLENEYAKMATGDGSLMPSECRFPKEQYTWS